VFRSSHPEAELKLVPMGSSQQIAALRAGEIDAGFVYQARRENPELEWREIAVDDRFVLALSADHTLAQRADLCLADLQGEDFIWPSVVEAPSVVYGQLMAACHLAGLKPRVVLEAEHSDTTLNFVASGMGVGFVPQAQQGRQPANVVLRRVTDLDLPLHLDLAWNRGDQSAVLAGFIETVMSLQGDRPNAKSPRARKPAKKPRTP
jgi:DNA-binding transcriptional LysR family regulator